MPRRSISGFNLADLFLWLWQFITWPVVMLLHWIGDIWWQLSIGFEKTGWSRWWRVLIWYALLPLVELGRFSRWAAAQMLNWPRMTHLRYFLEGAPALICALVLLVAFAWQTERSVDQYASAASEAFEAENFEAAEVYYKALVHMDGRDERFRFLLALTAEQMGEIERARALMAALAPRHSSGYWEAHYWQAAQMLGGPIGPEQIRAAEIHLLRTLEKRPNHYEAHAQLGKLFLVTGRIAQAEQHFLKSADVIPESHLALARIHVLQNKREMAQLDANNALRVFQRREAADLDDIDSRLMCAEAMLFLEQFQDAAAMINKGLAIDPNPRYGQALSRVYFIWAETLRQRGGRAVDQYNLLQRAYAANPKNELLLRRLTSALLDDNGGEADNARTAVKVLAAQHPQHALLQFLLGLDAKRSSRSSTAQRFFEEAHRLDPNAPQLVEALARRFVDAKEHGEALAVVDAGLQAWPGNPHLKHGRGYVLMRSGRWMEALVDLEQAEKQLRGDRRLHWTLYQVYQQTGISPQKAEEHKRIAFGPVLAAGDQLAALPPGENAQTTTENVTALPDAGSSGN